MEKTKSIEINQLTQNSIEIHNLFGFVIVAQQNFENDTNDVICIELSTIDILIQKLQQIKTIQMN